MRRSGSDASHALRSSSVSLGERLNHAPAGRRRYQARPALTTTRSGIGAPDATASSERLEIAVVLGVRRYGRRAAVRHRAPPGAARRRPVPAPGTASIAPRRDCRARPGGAPRRSPASIARIRTDSIESTGVPQSSTATTLHVPPSSRTAPASRRRPPPCTRTPVNENGTSGRPGVWASSRPSTTA